jgi:ribose transport system ATP-binding protein
MSQTTNTPQPIIEIRHVSKRFGGVTALDDVSLTVRPGELLAICGENGAGKSTLMKILCGQHTDYSGEIVLRGTPIRFRDIKDAEGHGVSIIHQELNLVEELSVAANIFLGRELVQGLFLNNREMNRRAREILSKFECDIDPQTPAGKLRIGDQQLIEIAKALSIGSAILIMDEPTSALTEAESARLDRVISQLRKSGVTILYISHKMEEIFRLSDRIAVLRDGRNVTVVETASVTPRQIAHFMVGRELNWESPPQKVDSNSVPPVLAVKNLYRRWPNHPRQWKLRDVSFEARPGEIVGFAGLMGAGRTELFECLFGQSEDDFHGDVRVNGRAVRFQHPAEAIEAGVAMVTEDRKRLGLFSNLCVAANISLNSISRDSRVSGLISGTSERQRCQSIVDQLRVKTDGLKAAIGSLSGGNQQKCVIGRSLLTEPRVLLLDDPTRGVDVGAKSEIYRLIRDLANKGLAVLMASSELPELLHLCDRIIVLSEGVMTAEFSARDATEQNIMEAATLNQKFASV